MKSHCDIGINFTFNNVNRVKHKVYEISALLNHQNIGIMGHAETFLKGSQLDAFSQ